MTRRIPHEKMPWELMHRGGESIPQGKCWHRQGLLSDDTKQNSINMDNKGFPKSHRGAAYLTPEQLYALLQAFENSVIVVTLFFLVSRPYVVCPIL